MASYAIFLTIIISAIVASTSGYTIGNPQAIKTNRSATSSASAVPPEAPAGKFDYRSQPIAGYPKVPPPNAHESGGSDGDLLPPFEDSPTGQFFRRSVEEVKVDQKTGYPLEAQPSWKYAGGDEKSLELPVEEEESGGEKEAVDPKTGYPLHAQPQWKDAGGDGNIIALPFEDDEENFGKKEEVDPKTGYPLRANPAWKDAGGSEDAIELPLEDVVKRSDEAVDPKTGYPLVAQEGWKDAGGDGDILELPREEPNQLTASEAVDPKTGYPLVAQEGWKYAGGDGDIIELPVEEPNQVTVSEAVDPKTGYPLVANPAWKDAGGDGDILELPQEDSNENTAVDPKTGYPLKALPSWKDAGGNGDILELPAEENSAPIDPKTGNPLLAQPSLRDAGGEGGVLRLPVKSSDKPEEGAVDPKTGYPLVAQPGWKDAGGNEDILQFPLETNEDANGELVERIGGTESQDFEIYKLTELQPPPLEKNFPTVFSNSFSTPSPVARKSSTNAFSDSNPKQNSFPSQTRFGLLEGTSDLRPVESSYSYTGPENTFVTVTRFLPKQSHQSNIRNGVAKVQNFQNDFEKPFGFHDSDGVPAHFGQPVSSQQRQWRNPNVDEKLP